MKLKKHIFECIQEKLLDRAEVMVGNRLELNYWDSLKNAFIQHFSDRRYKYIKVSICLISIN